MSRIGTELRRFASALGERPENVMVGAYVHERVHAHLRTLALKAVRADKAAALNASRERGATWPPAVVEVLSDAELQTVHADRRDDSEAE